MEDIILTTDATIVCGLNGRCIAMQQTWQKVWLCNTMRHAKEVAHALTPGAIVCGTTGQSIKEAKCIRVNDPFLNRNIENVTVVPHIG